MYQRFTMLVFLLKILLSVLALTLVACGAPQQPLAPESTASTSTKQIKVVTTMSVLADIIENVAGERVTAENIIPAGAGPENFQPKPQDAQKIAEADILFYNGFGLEDWLEPLFESAGKPDLPRIALAEGLTPIDVGNEEYNAGNPHFWMSAANGIKYVEKIRASLIKVDPAGEAVYTTNATSYSKQLMALNNELKQQANTLPKENRKLVTNHDAFPYFAQEYGFTIVGSILGNPESEPSAGDLAALITNIKRERVKAVFSESQFSQKITDAIRIDAGVQVVANLYTDTLGGSNGSITSYIDMLRYDMKTIVDALK